MNKILIIPDVHNKTSKVLKFLAKHGDQYNSIIQLGDWFDDFGDNAETVASVATDINQIVANYPIRLLWGNHDLPYRYPSDHTWCPGWSFEKMKAVVGTLDKKIWDRFEFFIEVDGYTLSHAGFYTPPVNLFPEALELALIDACPHPMLTIGKARGGRNFRGGPLWLDWDIEFAPVPGLKQIVGHTPHTQPQWKGENLCLDTHLNHYATLIDGVVEVFEWSKG